MQPWWLLQVSGLVAEVTTISSLFKLDIGPFRGECAETPSIIGLSAMLPIESLFPLQEFLFGRLSCYSVHRG